MKSKRKGNSIKWPLKFAIPFLILTSTSLVEAQTLQTLCSFNNTNGANPQAALTLGSDGNFYGTTYGGGFTNSTYPSGMGTVFKVTTNGTLTTLASFNSANGALPQAALTLGNDGNFYGTTIRGGATDSTHIYGMGTVFKVTTNGALTSLVYFNSANGALPYGALTLGNDGNFYGTTYGGGFTNSTYPSGMGTVFKVTTNGTLTTLLYFNGANGTSPRTALTLGNDGNFYGTTVGGGSGDNGGDGTVFKVTTNGTLTTLVSFVITNGASPEGSLALGNDGNFYGTTLTDRSGYGTIFRVTTNGTWTTLVSFSNTNGANPQAALTLGSDGSFYGTTQSGGITNSTYSYGMGAIFQVTTNGMLTMLASFANTNGANPSAALTQGNDGSFYGTTAGGGSHGDGTVFCLLFPLAIIVQPQSQTNNAGATVSFLVSAARSVSPLSYQWQRNGTNLVNGGSISGATTTMLTITGISDSDAASYSVIVSNPNSAVTSSNAVLTVINPPVITAQPSNLLVLPGTNAVFGVSLIGTSPFRYQWRFNGTSLLNATNAIYAIPSVSTNNAGNYAVVITNAAGTVTSSNAAFTVVLSPKSQTNYAGSIATFTATAFTPESLNYQWQKNGTNLVNGGNISGTTNGTLTITSVADADAANYSAVVSDASASVTTSNTTLTVNDNLFIASQPQSQTVGLGSNVTFNVIVYGAPPFVFQWYFNGTPLGSPATGTNCLSCTLTNVGTNQAGNYSVEVVNGYGSLMSSNAVLTVAVFPPSIGIQPSSQTVKLGSSVSFNVSVTGTPPFRYQWQFNGTNLLNATNATYAIQPVGATNTGNYSVVVTNLAGSAVSSNALLTVIVPPTLAIKVWAGYPLLNLNGMLSSNFVVQYGTNLAGTNWLNLLSLSNLSASPYPFLDPAGVGQPARFYRAFMQ
jgi:uncharacterized repeat protein (TIGR03803 family)